MSLEQEYQSRIDDGAMFLEIIIEDDQYNAPDQADLEQWGTRYGLTMPVLADPNSTTLYSFAPGGSVGLPFTVLLDHGSVVETADYPYYPELDALLDR